LYIYVPCFALNIFFLFPLVAGEHYIKLIYNLSFVLGFGGWGGEAPLHSTNMVLSLRGKWMRELGNFPLVMTPPPFSLPFQEVEWEGGW
jgi:hypothetical protein